MEDYYKILKVQQSCSLEDIKKSFRKLSLAHHPDKNQGSNEATKNFIKIQKAYEILSDPVKRSQYDAKHGTTNKANNGTASAKKEEPAKKTDPKAEKEKIYQQHLTKLKNLHEKLIDKFITHLLCTLVIIIVYVCLHFRTLYKSLTTYGWNGTMICLYTFYLISAYIYLYLEIEKWYKSESELLKKEKSDFEKTVKALETDIQKNYYTNLNFCRGFILLMLLQLLFVAIHGMLLTILNFIFAYLYYPIGVCILLYMANTDMI